MCRARPCARRRWLRCPLLTAMLPLETVARRLRPFGSCLSLSCPHPRRRAGVAGGTGGTGGTGGSGGTGGTGGVSRGCGAKGSGGRHLLATRSVTAAQNRHGLARANDVVARNGGAAALFSPQASLGNPSSGWSDCGG
jgi:hypothetical protein